MGWSLLSVRVFAAGPSPRPSEPWHFQHSSFWYRTLPCLMLSRERAGSGGTGMGSPGLSVTQRAENVLMKATRSARFCAVSVSQLGMLEVMKPRVMALKRSESSGSVPVGVERHLKVAATKLRGKGVTQG